MKTLIGKSGFSQLFLMFLMMLVFSACYNKQQRFDDGLKKINHIVVIYLENHSFDNLYSEFEGANGSDGKTNVKQVDTLGTEYKTLPVVPFAYGSATFPSNLANERFNIDQYVPSYIETPDVLHQYYEEQNQIDNGKMDRFAAFNSRSAGLTMGYYQTKMLPLYAIAKQYTLCDSFFHSAFGGSFLNHQWLIAAACPVYKSTDPAYKSTLDSMLPVKHPAGYFTDGSLTPDGYVVNTSYSVNLPKPDPSFYHHNPKRLIPTQKGITIGDELTDKRVTWGWYSGGWDNAMHANPAIHPDATFQYHHQPFIYYARYADTASKDRKEHLRDENEFIRAAKDGKLRQVSFVKPLGIDNEHPGYSEVFNGENHTVQLINAILNGPNGKDVVIIVTYDENGGFWDHVVPPHAKDGQGPGTRVPAIIISPFAKKGFVDHTPYETVSILALIERKFGLAPLHDRDRNANALQNAFDF